mgnify:CR=1 FL=1
MGPCGGDEATPTPPTRFNRIPPPSVPLGEGDLDAATNTVTLNAEGPAMDGSGGTRRTRSSETSSARSDDLMVRQFEAPRRGATMPGRGERAELV